MPFYAILRIRSVGALENTLICRTHTHTPLTAVAAAAAADIFKPLHRGLGPFGGVAFHRLSLIQVWHILCVIFIKPKQCVRGRVCAGCVCVCESGVCV